MSLRKPLPQSQPFQAVQRSPGIAVEAATVAEGLAQLDPPPDCIVLDLELPDGPGEAILRKVRMERLPIRVFVSSGMRDSARLSEVGAMRPDAFLQKPLDSAGLQMLCE